MNAAAQVLLFEQPEMTPGQKLASVWKEYREMVKGHWSALAQLQAKERTLFPSLESYRYSVAAKSESDLARELSEAARGIIQSLAWMASAQFSPAGGRLEIDLERLHEAFPIDKYSSMDVIDAFDPAKVWEWLETNYGGDAGQKLASQQLAKRLQDALGLNRQEEIVMKGGYVVLSMTAWTDSYSSGTTYSYQTVESIRKRLLALSEVAEWMERHPLSRDLYGHFTRMGFYDKVVSRQKCGFGVNDTEVVMITFKSSVEFRLRQDFAEELQVFLGTYGAANHEEM